jgi:hypothetical protein
MPVMTEMHDSYASEGYLSLKIITGDDFSQPPTPQLLEDYAAEYAFNGLTLAADDPWFDAYFWSGEISASLLIDRDMKVSVNEHTHDLIIDEAAIMSLL